MLPVLLIILSVVVTFLIIGAMLFWAGRRYQKRAERQEEHFRSLPPLAHRMLGQADENRRSGCGRILLFVFAVVIAIWLIAVVAFRLPFNQAGNEALRLGWPAFWAVLGLQSLSTSIFNWRSCRSRERVLVQLPRTDEERQASGMLFIMLAILTPFAWSEYDNARPEAAAAILFSGLCIGMRFAIAYRQGVAFTETGITAAGRHYPWSTVSEWEWSSDQSCVAIAILTGSGPGCLSVWLEDDPAAHQEIEQILRESVSLIRS